MELTTELTEKVGEFLAGLQCDNVDIPYYIDIENIDLTDPYQSMYDMIHEGGGFNVEFIYYGSAMEFLTKNDPSLQQAMEEADNRGFTLSNLNSEVLASILASKYAIEDFQELEGEITDFFEEIVEELEALEEDEV